jgi:hypothetical protein
MTYNRNRQQALKAYREKQESIARLIDGIRGKLEADAKQSDITWASVGSLGHVEELLRELDEFLS